MVCSLLCQEYQEIELPVSKQKLLEHVEKLYSGWFKIFKETVVPRLINQPRLVLVLDLAMSYLMENTWANTTSFELTDSEQEEENLDTLTRLLVSTGFSLDHGTVRLACKLTFFAGTDLEDPAKG